MSQSAIDTGSVTFETEGRLLQELGERLVAFPEVALVELIKNAYDADSSTCSVTFSGHNSLIVQDNGHGMTLREFQKNWMRIATSNKQQIMTSRTYHRKLTGAKGIGRFAVRFLGRRLEINSVAIDEERSKATRLIAYFDWEVLDNSTDLRTVQIPYKLFDAGEDAPIGTTLSISSLKQEIHGANWSTIKTEVLKITTPLSGLERGPFQTTSTDADPGFNVSMPGQTRESETEDKTLATQVLDNAWGKLLIELSGETLTYSVFFGDDKRKPTGKLRHRFKHSISKGAFADIRFFPRRAGIFSQKDFDGNAAWKWIRINHGVGVVDHGFRIKPYGYPDDDWLHLAIDLAHNKREWRSGIMKDQYPISETQRNTPSENPMLYLPSSHQLVGAVFVESRQQLGRHVESDLIPSMDREGFLENEALKQLKEIVRGGIEFLALWDEKEETRREQEKANAAAKRAREDFKKAIAFIEKSPTLTQPDKNRIVSEYSRLADQLEEVDEYHRQARQGLETMSLLGVVAGFMTHESGRMLVNLESAVSTLQKLSIRYPQLREPTLAVASAYEEFRGHVDYTSTFIDAVHNSTSGSFKAAPQIKRVVEKFGRFAKTRGIEIIIEIDSGILVTNIPVPIYSGVLLNLYSNAIKAVIAGPSKREKAIIMFRCWNETKEHIVEVIDNGIGIPPELKHRIWDPLFTTTSRLNNPLGSGMGLGLSIVRKLVSDLGGSIKLAKPPVGFSTCFRIEFPR